MTENQSSEPEVDKQDVAKADEPSIVGDLGNVTEAVTESPNATEPASEQEQDQN